MASNGSVTAWLGDLKNGNSYAQHALWQRYVQQLVKLATRKLATSVRRVADEEDVVNAAFNSFLRGVEAGRFSELNDRQDLWQVLCVLTERRAIDQIRRETTEKKGSGQVRGDSVFVNQDRTPAVHGGFSNVVDPQPTPAFAAQVVDEFSVLIDELKDATLRKIAIAKMEGYTNAEVATLLDTSERTIERRLSLIRRIWRQVGEHERRDD